MADRTCTQSDPVDPKVVAASGCTTTLPVRLHKYTNAIDQAVTQFHVDWRATFGPVALGTTSPVGNFCALTIPECLPDRMEAYTYLTEFLFAWDDMVDNVDASKAGDVSSVMAYSSHGENVPAVTEEGLLQKCAFQARVFQKLLDVDPVQGHHLIDAVKTFASEQWYEMKSPVSFQDFDDWLVYRWYDSACLVLMVAIQYCCNLDLTQAEREAVSHITWPCLTSTVIANDIDSYEKEVREAKMAGKSDGVPNSVWILEQTQHMSVAQAKSALVKKMRDLEMEYFTKKQSYAEEHPDMKRDLLLYLEYVGYMSGGNMFWGTAADRYQRQEQAEEPALFSDVHTRASQ